MLMTVRPAVHLLPTVIVTLSLRLTLYVLQYNQFTDITEIFALQSVQLLFTYLLLTFTYGILLLCDSKYVAL
jgi:hypothetical protein